ncbi:MAG: hypothetical protein QMD77_00925 [Patescibacteria group bacterium]|nr:hypothetical protein [Patescibacteria group bacterium]
MLFSENDIKNLIQELSLGHIDVENLLEKIFANGDFGVLHSLRMNELYGKRILELHELCNRSYERFVYHVCAELPHQRIGKVVSIASPYIYIMGIDKDILRLTHHIQARQFGEPGSLWGLKDPPCEKDYEFPIYTLVLNLKIRR